VAKSMDVGTPGYCAPELLLRTHMVSSYDGKKADGAPPLPCPTHPKTIPDELLRLEEGGRRAHATLPHLP